nr:hypothetical protein CFP56_64101 [Quercus suber]
MFLTVEWSSGRSEMPCILISVLFPKKILGSRIPHLSYQDENLRDLNRCACQKSMDCMLQLSKHGTAEVSAFPRAPDTLPEVKVKVNKVLTCSFRFPPDAKDHD